MVEVVNSGSSKDPHIMQLVRSLFFIVAHFEITLQAVHVVGKENSKDDAISRNKIAVFLSQAPKASPEPTPIPPQLVDLLVTQRPDWTSPTWSQLFSSCLRLV